MRGGSSVIETDFSEYIGIRGFVIRLEVEKSCITPRLKVSDTLCRVIRNRSIFLPFPIV
ncbi:hypothetical protein ZMO1_ZMOp39x017 (plasmid) [Zymomonas mobilis subsp. mobilis ZM4 = ATCC 31821]|nr:hypothetical protein ZMO2_ZMOp39x017 [Zymomonas mobilis subsp. mobilis]AVZ28760.1 hypothetical protein ZMO3_ZMOp39x017 [Zymomonas mobilis subsp. mobilis]AVZ43253.1 hypothetical protein ZMO1_ZMOp39x017 [Zymomonas mobilis subsp. mobilis ZM4 = ATCC 31821]